MTLNNLFRFLSLAIVGSILVGCSATGSYTSNKNFDASFIGPIESKGIAYQGVYRNPVILVHGFLGSNLVDEKTSKNLWGSFSGVDALSVSSEKMRGLAIPMEIGKSLEELNDNTVPAGMLNTVSVELFGIPIKEDAYLNLVNVLQDGGFQAEGLSAQPGKNYNTLFQFSYDWRRDLQWNAAKLHQFILEKRSYMQKQYERMYGIKEFDVQFDLIGHSMGGLVSRYFLRYGSADLPPENTEPKVSWAGSKYIDRLIILGTPNAGYLDTVIEMQRGTSIPSFPPALLGTWPAYYQMMPAPSRNSVVYKGSPDKVFDLFDVNSWKSLKWGLANPKQADVLKELLPNVKNKADRRQIALDHLEKCLKRAKRFIEVMQVDAQHPEDVKLYLVLGNAVKTTRKAVVDETSGELEVIEYAAGDGKVTKTSAMFDKRAGQEWEPFFSSPISWDSIIQLRAAHMGITTDPALKDNILFLLNSIPTAKHLKNMKKLEG